MKLGQVWRAAAVSAVVLALAPLAQAGVVYNVDRTVGAGTVTGFLETDGTIGALTNANFLSWSITITAPNINGGVPTTGVTGSASLFDGLSATATDLLFDFSSSALAVIWNDAFSDWWCLSGSAAGCFVSNAETIGYADDDFLEAQSAAYSGVQSIGRVSSNVPTPATLALLGIGLVGLGVARRAKPAAH